jgi:uncharacterized membrane protein YfcA
MTLWYAAILFLAGIGGGLAGSIAGLASLSTYPALLGLGLVPAAANVTNTAALICNGAGSAFSSVPELRGQSAALKRLVPIAVIGGAGGAALMLSIPPGYFEYVVPVILSTAAVVVALPQRRPTLDSHQGPLRGAAILAICVQGGFFGAAAGVLMLAVLGVTNCSATLVFVVFAPIHWLAVAAIGRSRLPGGLADRTANRQKGSRNSSAMADRRSRFCPCHQARC